MEGLLDLFECIIDSPRHGEYLQEFLKACTEHQAFYKQKSKTVQPFISFTNSKLNESSDRLEGLLLLKTFLPQCSDEQFSDNAVSWMLQCVKGIETPNNVETNNAAYSVLKSLLQMSSSFQELTKNITQSVISKLVEQVKLSSSKPQVKLPALQCVQVLIQNYGAPCVSHRTAIESVVLEYVDNKEPPLVAAASRCFALLPLVGGAGSQGTNHKARWLEQQRRACSTLQMLLDQLLDGVREVGNFTREDNSEILPLDSLDDMNPVVRIHQVANRFVNVTKFLEAMLLTEFPVAKSVLPDLIMSIVCRGLSVNCCTLGDKGSSDLLTVGSVLPRIHVALLRVLRSLIVCVGKNLYPQAKAICRLVLQTLKWTASSNSDHATTRPYATLRVEACQTLIAWLRVAKAGSCVEFAADELVLALSQDVTSEKAAVKLNVQVGKKNKKRKQNTAAEETASTPQSATLRVSTRTKLADPTANSKPCQAALELLCCLVYAAGVLIKPALHKSLQETSLLVLLDMQRSTRGDLPVPYSKVECRVWLYKLLQALTLEPHPMWPPPTQFALHVFAQGQADPSNQVSGFCTVALCSVEKLIHSSSHTLHFPVSRDDALKGVDPEPTAAAADDSADVMSVASAHWSVDSGATSPTRTPRDLDLTAALTVLDKVVPPVVDEKAQASPNFLLDLTDESENEEEEEVVNEVVIEPQASQVSTNMNGKQGFSQDDILENGNAKKRKLMEDVLNTSSSSQDSSASESSSHKKSNNQSKKKLTNVKTPIGIEKADVSEATVLPETEPIQEGDGAKCEGDILAVTPQSLTKGKMFHGKFSDETSPKLLGGSEVIKITRFNLKPKFVNLSDDENESVVNLSSDDEFHESNISVVSSNSTYQESILNKSGITADGDNFEDLEEETDDAALALHKPQETVTVILEETEPESVGDHKKDLVSKSNTERGPTEELDSEGSNSFLVIDLEMTNGSLPVLEPGSRREEMDRIEPSPKRLKTGGAEPSNDTFEGMTDAEVVKTLVDDFQKNLSN